ncbi:SDR family NAD(P)-dependent oxidoreductase [Baekduia soli]|nr:SDR family NAD(P)-dependent oxidoreductase [Baekduia soli]
MLTLEGRIAIITAAASGIGRASAEAFAAYGAHVIVVDIDGPRTAEVVEAIHAGGGSAEGHVVDLLDQDAVDGLFSALASAHDRVDVLFNHAGAPGPKGFELTHEQWLRCVRLNLWAPTAMTQGALPLLRRSDRSPSIIYTASTAAVIASPNSPTDSASKAGVLMFAKSVAVALAPEGIRANVLMPGLVETPMLPTFFSARSEEDPEYLEALARYQGMVPMGRLGRPPELAAVAAFLASDAAPYMTGAAITVDGGLSAF